MKTQVPNEEPASPSGLEKLLSDPKAKLWTTEEFCRKFGITRRTAYQWRMKQVVRAHRIQGRVYFVNLEVNAALDKL